MVFYFSESGHTEIMDEAEQFRSARAFMTVYSLDEIASLIFAIFNVILYKISPPEFNK